VCAWYRKSLRYMRGNPAIKAALVSTNSIVQGEQVSALWPILRRDGLEIAFAHRTFQWSSEAKGKAAVQCVIIGFTIHIPEDRWIFEYEDPKSDSHAIRVGRINPYLVDAPDVFLQNRRSPISTVPEIVWGSMPNDGGHLLLTDEEKRELLAKEPAAEPLIRRFVGADEFLYDTLRWCLWLKDVAPDRFRSLSEIKARIQHVRAYRTASKRAATRRLASTPALFGEIRQPDAEYLLIPAHTSETRRYIPFGYMSPDVICGNANLLIPEATHYEMGVLSSLMHMAWVRSVCGRLESRYRYSAGIVYNNFPWPEPTAKQHSSIESAARGVLVARSKTKGASLAELYDPLTMPADLVKAHQTLDRLVDVAYRKAAFKSEAERVAYLFELYQMSTQPLS